MDSQKSPLYDVNKDDEMSLKDIILKLKNLYRYLLSEWKPIILAGLIGGAIGFSYAYLKKTIYTAHLSFALEDEKASGGTSGYAAIAGQFGIDLGGGGGGGAFSGDNLIELMKSRRMVEKTLLTVVKTERGRETLADLYIRFNDFRKKWDTNPVLEKLSFNTHHSRNNFSLQHDSVLSEFYKSLIKSNLFVNKADKKLSIISVRVDSKSEIFSKSFAEELVKNVSQFYIETKTKKSKQNVSILQHQTDSVRKELNRAIFGAASSIDANPNVNPSRQILRVPSQHRQFEVQANQAILSELVKNLEIAKVSLRKETPLVQVIDAPIYPLEKNKLGKFKAAIIGTVLSLLLSVLFLTGKRFWIKVLNEA